MGVLLGKVLCGLPTNPRSPFKMSPLPSAELWQERGLLGDSHPALPPAPHGHCPPSRGQAAIQGNGDVCGGLDEGE